MCKLIKKEPPGDLFVAHTHSGKKQNNNAYKCRGRYNKNQNKSCMGTAYKFDYSVRC